MEDTFALLKLLKQMLFAVSIAVEVCAHKCHLQKCGDLNDKENHVFCGDIDIRSFDSKFFK